MLIDALKNIVGPGGWTTEPRELQPLLTEWRRCYQGATPIAVFPNSTEQVAAVVRACANEKVGIVPQGGNTGMCAGAIPDESGTQIIVNLRRMNSIRNVDAANYSMEVDAGCILENIQQAAIAENRFFALSLGAEGSCQIGGNLATNAGGINVVRYGTTRAQVLGLEAVLADGSIVSSLRSLRKDTAGYDLKQLFIGSEGTLGIITATSLKLFPVPRNKSTVMLTLPTSGSAVRLLNFLREQLGDCVEAFELISDFVFGLVLKHVPGSRLPFAGRSPWYVLADFSGVGNEHLEEVLMRAFDTALVGDVVIAKNSAESDSFWHMRHSISASEKAEFSALKHDISVPVSRLEEFLLKGDELLARIVPDGQLVAFGHVGDGNLHYNVSLPEGFAEGEAVTAEIYALLMELGGSFSAEHGVGRSKREYLAKYRGEGEVALMKRIKSALDPDNIMNPGKVI